MVVDFPAPFGPEEAENFPVFHAHGQPFERGSLFKVKKPKG